MNYTSLKYFLVVSKELNITKAARKLYISQQSLSEHIAKLEEEYQVRLFERTPRLMLTFAGEYLQKMAEKVISLNHQIEDELADLSQQKKICLEIGMSPVHGRIILPHILPLFCRNNPNVELHFTLESSEQVVQKLIENQLDLAVCFQPIFQDNNIQTIELGHDNLCLVMSETLLRAHGFSSEVLTDPSPEPLREALGKLPFLLSAPGTRIRGASELYLSEREIEPHVLLMARDLEVVFQLCEKGMGVMFAFEIFARHHIQESRQRDKLFCVPLDVDVQGKKLILAYRQNRYQKNAAVSFRHSMQGFFEE